MMHVPPRVAVHRSPGDEGRYLLPDDPQDTLQSLAQVLRPHACSV